MSQTSSLHDDTHATHELLTVVISGQQFGIPILDVQDVLKEQDVTPVPLSNDIIHGTLNLRGRIVTAINVSKRLGLPVDVGSQQMSVVVEHGQELYSLIIDDVGDVLRTRSEDIDRNPATMDSLWRDVSLGVHKLDGELMVVLDIAKLLEFEE